MKREREEKNGWFSISSKKRRAISTRNENCTIPLPLKDPSLSLNLEEVRSFLPDLVNVLPILGDDSLVLVVLVDVKSVLELELVELLRVELDLGVFESFPPPSGFDLGEFGEFGVAESEVLLESTSTEITESSVSYSSSVAESSVTERAFLERHLRIVVVESSRIGRKFSILPLGSVVVELTLREFGSRLNIGRDFGLRVDGRRS